MPFRPMLDRDGVLEYIDGGEVALWGVNYYSQSFGEFQLFKNQKNDIKTAINADLDALVRDTKALFMQASATDWQPLPLPEKPTPIIAVGSTLYFDYDGTGIVDIHIQGDTAEVRLNH